MNIGYENYEKISDIVMPLSYNATLKMNVILGKKNAEGKRIICHREYKYNSDKYINYNNLISVTRVFDYYLSIESYDSDRNKNFIMIKNENIMSFRIGLEKAVKLMNQDNLYGLFRNKLKVLNGYEPIIIDNLPMGKTIKIDPIVVKLGEIDEAQGMRMYLNGLDDYVDMTNDRFMGFVYNINSIYLYGAAQNLLNYLQRPQYGTNMTTFESNSNRRNENNIESVDEVSVRPNNKVKHTSVFDDIDNLGNE